MACTQQFLQARASVVDQHGPPVGTGLAVQDLCSMVTSFAADFDVLLYAT